MLSFLIEGHAPRLQIVQKADQVAQRAVQPIQLPDREGVAFTQSFEAFRQLRPLDMCYRSFLNKDTLASDLLQGGKLQVGVLVFGRDLRIADVYEPALSLISGTTKPLI